MGSGREGTPWTNRGRQPSAEKKVLFNLVSVKNLAESSCVDLLGDKNKELKQQVKWVNPKWMWSSCSSDQAAGGGVLHMPCRGEQVYPEGSKSFTLLWTRTVKDVRNGTIHDTGQTTEAILSYSTGYYCVCKLPAVFLLNSGRELFAEQMGRVDIWRNFWHGSFDNRVWK